MAAGVLFSWAMDISRPDLKLRKRRRTLTFAALGVTALAVAAFFLLRLKPAMPPVERSSVWTDVVKRGELIRQVRGPGSLVPRGVHSAAERPLESPLRTASPIKFPGN